MAFNDIERKRVEKAMEAYLAKKRPPPHLRPQLDIAYRLTNQSVEVFEVRPDWQGSDKKMEAEVAKATYVRTQNVWKIYWMRRDLKWHGYEPLPEVDSVDDFLEELEKDPWCCFWG